jgi:GT2 family glycosyltransferase
MAISKVSILLVVTTEEEELLMCLVSLFAGSHLAKYPIEVVVADNNPKARLKKVIKKKFPKVKYKNTGGNIGFGPANNVAASQATGDYLFFLNSDTELEPDAIDELAQFLDTHEKVGVVAPTLFDMDGKRYDDQGSAKLTPISILAAHSIFTRIWPNNPIAHHYWQRDRDVTKNHQLAVVPGTALVVRRNVFEEIGGFDERFFLYFEESDLCRRVIDAGWQVWQIPSSKVRHIWHAATKSSKYTVIFRQSRYKYFQKYYGSTAATLLELLLQFGKVQLIISAIIVLIIALFLLVK